MIMTNPNAEVNLFCIYLAEGPSRGSDFQGLWGLSPPFGLALCFTLYVIWTEFLGKTIPCRMKAAAAGLPGGWFEVCRRVILLMI